MACWCGAGYEDASLCPRCASSLPPPPDGPDELLLALAAQDAHYRIERAFAGTLEAGARRCRYCREQIPPGPSPGVHEACLPAFLPDGARSCAGCAELLLSDEDEFDHDFCITPADDMPSEDDEPLDLSTEDDDAPTEPMLELPEPSGEPVRVRDVLRCSCGHVSAVELVAPLDAHRRRMLSGTTLECPCGRLVTGVFSWVRGCFVSVRSWSRVPELPN